MQLKAVKVISILSCRTVTQISWAVAVSIPVLLINSLAARQQLETTLHTHTYKYVFECASIHIHEIT